MKKIKRFYKSHQELMNSIILNAVWMLTMILFMHPHFVGNDDYSLNKIASGALGEEFSEYLIYNNILYGLILKGLYGVFQGVNWYGVIPIILTFLAFTLIIYLFQKESKISVGLLFGTALLFFISKELYFDIQWTQSAGFMAAAGLFALFCSQRRKEYGIILKILGILLCTFGLWIRRDAFLSVTAVIGMSLVIDFLDMKVWKFGLSKMIKRYLSWIIVGVVFVCSTLLNSYVYQSDSEWSYFLQYNEVRSALVDYGVPHYGSHVEEYQSIGIDEHDVTMLATWSYADLDKFSLETLKAIKEIKDGEKQYYDHVEITKNAILDIAKAIYKYMLNMAILVLAIVGLTLVMKKKNILFPIAVTIAELYYLSYRGRFLFRAYFSIFLALFLMITYYVLQEKKVKKLDRPKCACVLAVLTVLRIPWICELTINNEWGNYLESQQDIVQWVEELAKDKETLYVGEAFEENYPNAYSIFNYEKYDVNNLYFLGGWYCPSPISQNVLTQYGVIDNGIYDALINNNENVYYVESKNSDYIDKELIYIRKEYNQNICYEKIDRIDRRVDVFRFYEKYEIDFDDVREENFQYKIENVAMKEEGVRISGWCKSETIDPYKQNVYLKLQNQSTGETKILAAEKKVRKRVGKKLGGIHDAAVGFRCDIDRKEINKGVYKVEFIISDGNKSVTDNSFVTTLTIK